MNIETPGQLITFRNIHTHFQSVPQFTVSLILQVSFPVKLVKWMLLHKEGHLPSIRVQFSYLCTTSTQSWKNNSMVVHVYSDKSANDNSTSTLHSISKWSCILLSLLHIKCLKTILHIYYANRIACCPSILNVLPEQMSPVTTATLQIILHTPMTHGNKPSLTKAQQ